MHAPDGSLFFTRFGSKTEGEQVLSAVSKMKHSRTTLSLAITMREMNSKQAEINDTYTYDAFRTLTRQIDANGVTVTAAGAFINLNTYRLAQRARPERTQPSG